MYYFGVLQFELFVECEGGSIIESVFACAALGLGFELIFFEGVIGGDDKFFKDAGEWKWVFMLVGDFERCDLNGKIIHNLTTNNRL